MKNIEDASIFIVLHQLMHLCRYLTVRQTEDLELNPSQSGILFILDHEGQLSQRQLAEKIGMTPPSMTVTLRKLEELGYIRKLPDEADQRVIRICISEKGQECIGKLKRVMEDLEEIVYRGFSPEERMLFRRLVLEMRRNLLESKNLRGMDLHEIMRSMKPHG